jgi:hypothetical protein
MIGRLIEIEIGKCCVMEINVEKTTVKRKPREPSLL